MSPLNPSIVVTKPNYCWAPQNDSKSAGAKEAGSSTQPCEQARRQFQLASLYLKCARIQALSEWKANWSAWFLMLNFSGTLFCKITLMSILHPEACVVFRELTVQVNLYML